MINRFIVRHSSLLILTFILILPINAVGQNDSSIVDLYGLLQVNGNRIVDKNENPVALRGMSLFWSQWSVGSKYYNADCIAWLRDDWHCGIIRAAMAVEYGGYLANPETEKAKIVTVVDACLDLGLYVIIDWHDHNAHHHEDKAKKFFAEMAEKYGEEPNVIYEIYNEPLDTTSWSMEIKPYAEAVIDTIRSIDADNLIIVGTPAWSQDVVVASNDPLAYDNIAYALHFYAATHKQWLRDKAATALNNGIALFVTEWGTCNSSAQGDVDYTSTEAWWKFMDQNMISWCNWSICDKEETAAALMPEASAVGGWSESDISESGMYVRNKIMDWYEETFTAMLDDVEPLILDFELYQNYPNPFNPNTTISYTVGTNNHSPLQHVDLSVYNILGQKVATLVSEKQRAGTYNVKFKAINLVSGIYLYSLKAGNSNLKKKMILIR